MTDARASHLAWRGDPAELVVEFDPDVLRESMRTILDRHRQDWAANAACRGEPIDVFFPRRGQSIAPAIAICNTCTVRGECLAEALALPPDDDIGVRGGLSGRQRRQLRAERATAEGRRHADGRVDPARTRDPRLEQLGTGPPPTHVASYRCRYSGCTAAASSAGLCGAHYMRWYRWRRATANASRPDGGEGGRGRGVGSRRDTPAGSQKTPLGRISLSETVAPGETAKIGDEQ